MEKKLTTDYIRAIAEVRSISLAAENLGISQPALSAYLKKQEKDLGVLLFDRSKQPLELTEAGKLYLDYLERRHSVYNEFRQNLSDLEGLKTGFLTVGGASFFNVAYVADAAAAFSCEYPGVKLEILDAKVPELVTDAQKGLVDIFITPLCDDEERFVYEEFIEEKIYLAVPSDWELNSEMSEPLSQEDFARLCEEQFIILKQNQDIGKKIRQLCAKYDCEPKRTITVEQTMTSLALTVAGAGISLITESSVRSIKSLANASHLSHIKLYMPDDEICTRKMYVAYPKNKYLSRPAKEFIRVLHEKNKRND